MHVADDLPGRAGILNVFGECLKRGPGTPRALPVLVMLGPKGSGKTTVLRYLAQALEQSVGIPYAHIDCAESGYDSAGRLLSDVADELRRPWKEFGRPLRFPRLTLGRLAIGTVQLPEDPNAAKEQLLENLRQRAKLRQHGDSAHGIVLDVAQAMDFPMGQANLVGRAIRAISGSRTSVDAWYHTGLRWYARRTGQHRDGPDELVKLNWLVHRDGRRREAELILVDAFLGDLRATFARKRQFNCVALLDNGDNQAATELLNLIAEARASSRNPVRDPLVVLAASGTLPKLSGLRERWIMPWEHAPLHPLSDKPEIPSAGSVRGADWLAGSDRLGKPQFWWLPVHLQDLTHTELARVVPECNSLVHRLTAGHPWSARHLSGSSTDPHTLSGRFPPAVKYMLDDLSTQERAGLVRCAAARDIDFAIAARMHSPGLAASDLSIRLEHLQWLVRGNSRRGPRLHPWLRYLLLRELANAGDSVWVTTHKALREYATKQGLPIVTAYHALACGDITAAVGYLHGRLDGRDRIDAESWIDEFEHVAGAPRRADSVGTADAQYDALVDRANGDDLSDALQSMVAARWIWTDPIGDPELLLKDVIANGFTELGRQAPSGHARYHREAARYREMRP